ncbi:MAG: Vitamin K epoxide reductase [Clostridia bacterium]|nr:Vitamin K epoxide reductase [Clostridia bacterium]MCL6522558.1 Vitamin K epoxide reductase [Bacillota bacterium]
MSPRPSDPGEAAARLTGSGGLAGRPLALRLALAGAGLAVSGYLTLLHWAPRALACPNAGLVDCASVLESGASVWWGVPVAAWGLLWFLVAGLLALRAGSGLRLLWAAAGALAVVGLVYTELFVVGAICLWCTLVHLLVLALFALETAAYASGA